MRQRLDQELVARGLARTRAQARDLILRGEVFVAGQAAAKPSQPVAADTEITITGDSAHYVSRGALKLIAGLDAFGFDPAGCVAIDVGASTGGFTQVLLERGAAKVYAVDVGRDQLHEELGEDPRVTKLESTDIRDLTADTVQEPVTALVADVSFISLKKALPAVLDLTAPGAWLVALVKPQFEVGREAVGKGGIVRDSVQRQTAADDIAAWIGARQGWRLSGIVESPISGGDGNKEFLLGATRHG
ncbi:23S rRNA (cytidine1920-2'-O)/16S rRNA (cytidine1409-2'-O)-methyltransferase [Filomicrobium insigne]|uniref:23S rRNA (Cytidine1920-2'-O)/16S rRNA (Cytidine1409-2'-O)-methyltransferase n=1 Tax=Filomicrobium insigne TaxID=418854 RepID=A0A1H0J803_9HYPH|nr:TlyA family RNA methyltransferase [Filomicrobium insigne]SDO39774.1 23S rRNA (cytidine1920-2'-O)/16S rRNA (cytidine1409-2'-O)-methyltransferase [Filomicrobium insigne]